MAKKKRRFGSLLAGVAIGTGLGMIFAPKAGSETRKELKEKLDEMIDRVKHMDKEEVKETVEKKIEEIKKELDELDKEKVAKIAKQKAKDIQKKTEELVEYAIDKGTPILENTANAIREKAIEVTKEVLNRLEKESK